ncbi:MAG: glutathione peroxidase [Cytophagales bacterium]|nr:MAG: glutathione peroxidase [Cytophagales bacterium]
MKRIFTLLTIAVLAMVAFNAMSLSTIVKGIFGSKDAADAAPANVAASAKTLFDFSVKSIDGKSVSLAQYKGKKVVILNTASKCGFTPQYADWEKFYEANKDKVVVLGFPANNFMSQEPGSNNDIAAFCQKNYGVSFPMFEKVEVTGNEQHPLYQWLSKKTQNGWNDKAPSWNFCKYVVNEQGQLTHFFESKIKPNDAEFKRAIGL